MDQTDKLADQLINWSGVLLMLGMALLLLIARKFHKLPVLGGLDDLKQTLPSIQLMLTKNWLLILIYFCSYALAYYLGVFTDRFVANPSNDEFSFGVLAMNVIINAGLFLVVNGLISIRLCWSLTHILWDQMFEPTEEIIPFKVAWLRLLLIDGLFGIGCIFGFLAFVFPGCWWIIKSSLAFTVSCVERTGVIKSLVTSHKLLDGNFFFAVRYLVPVSLLIMGLPVIMDCALSIWEDHLTVSASSSSIVTVYAGLRGFEGILSLFSYLIIFPLLIRLYARLRQVK